MNIIKIIAVSSLAVMLATGPIMASDSSTLAPLTVEKIMRDPHWIGVSPSGIHWSEDSRQIFFDWNPEGTDDDSLYVVNRIDTAPVKVSLEDRLAKPSRRGDYDRSRKKKVYEKNGDIFILNIKSGKTQQLTNTLENESNPVFSLDDTEILYTSASNLFARNVKTGVVRQLTDFRNGKKPDDDEKSGDEHDQWIESEEMKLIRTLARNKEKEERQKEYRKSTRPDRPLEIYLGDNRAQQLQLSGDQRFVIYRSSYSTEGRSRTKIHNYVTESGYAEDFDARAKVGEPWSHSELGLYDREKDTAYLANLDELPGIFDKPAYLLEYETESSDVDFTDTVPSESKPARRKVRLVRTVWSDNGVQVMAEFVAIDNKDRWITLLDPASGKLSLIDRQHDDAWVGGPSLGGWYGSNVMGWMADNETVWFLSEATGYTHLYTHHTVSGERTQLTDGEFELYDVRLSYNQKVWYFTSNEIHPGERRFYRMAVNGGPREQITSLSGNCTVKISPDEKHLAIRRSYSNQPWELYLQENKPGAEARRITYSQTEEFLAYPWRDPDLITFSADDGATVYAHLYKPDNPQPGAPAVVFVHGAGYTQNVRKRWSYYFREYMFHNLLADNGYFVLDIDYRGSAGYGRDWRVGIYRHMGGKDLSDQVDGVKYLIEQHDVDPGRVGIYGGSYGGFITLMAMFTEPDVFAAGAALRSVTDWAHYNHGYTSDILNLPCLDSLAYVRSSPIYFAEGLKGALLICHGMLDANVQFQDVVRLAQRLIELGKENWEIAVYPLEGHGFQEPESWTDEYKRIFKLFEDNLK